MRYNSKLSKYKVKKIRQCFCIDIDATKTAQLLSLNRNTINRWYGIFRQVIYEYQMGQKINSTALLKSMKATLERNAKEAIMVNSNEVVAH